MNRELLIAQETLANHYEGRLRVYIHNNKLRWNNVRTPHIKGDFGFYISKKTDRLCFGMKAERSDIRLVAKAIKDAEYF